jgi:hypothetical protein
MAAGPAQPSAAGSKARRSFGDCVVHHYRHDDAPSPATAIAAAVGQSVAQDDTAAASDPPGCTMVVWVGDGAGALAALVWRSEVIRAALGILLALRLLRRRRRGQSTPQQRPPSNSWGR